MQVLNIRECLEALGVVGLVQAKDGSYWCDYDDQHSVKFMQTSTVLLASSKIAELPVGEYDQLNLLKSILEKNVGSAAFGNSTIIVEEETASVVLQESFELRGLTLTTLASCLEKYFTAHDFWIDTIQNFGSGQGREDFPFYGSAAERFFR